MQSKVNKLPTWWFFLRKLILLLRNPKDQKVNNSGNHINTNFSISGKLKLQAFHHFPYIKNNPIKIKLAKTRIIEGRVTIKSPQKN
ncbi:hypothetical protein AAZX31_09G251300 [Glycine max]